MSSFDISKVKRLKREDFLVPKITLEKIKEMCSFLDEENPATYEVFLKYRPDLSEDEVNYYRDIIATLHYNIELKRQMIEERGLISFEEYLTRLEEPKVIVESENVAENIKN